MFILGMSGTEERKFMEYNDKGKTEGRREWGGDGVIVCILETGQLTLVCNGAALISLILRFH